MCGVLHRLAALLGMALRRVLPCHCLGEQLAGPRARETLLQREPDTVLWAAVRDAEPAGFELRWSHHCFLLFYGFLWWSSLFLLGPLQLQFGSQSVNPCDRLPTITFIHPFMRHAFILASIHQLIGRCIHPSVQRYPYNCPDYSVPVFLPVKMPVNVLYGKMKLESLVVVEILSAKQGSKSPCVRQVRNRESNINALTRGMPGSPNSSYTSTTDGGSHWA